MARIFCPSKNKPWPSEFRCSVALRRLQDFAQSPVASGRLQAQPERCEQKQLRLGRPRVNRYAVHAMSIHAAGWIWNLWIVKALIILPDRRSKAAKSLPISWLFPAPTRGNLGSTGATTGNLQIAGRMEDSLESAIGNNQRQDTANHLRFGC